jgi:hypothetical protein
VSISWGHWMSEIMASLAPASTEDEGALVRGGVLVPVGALVQEGARVREGRRRESPLSRLRGDDPAHSLVMLVILLGVYLFG